jgi:DNA-binding transcriptional LysR family regulator
MPKAKSSSKGGTKGPVVKLASLRQALLVADYLSFRRAAAVLGVRQSAVSRRVRELEDELGVSLFERHSGGVRVTNAGACFLPLASDGIRQLDRAAKAARAAGDGSVGQLEVAILSSVAAGYLRELFEVYSSHHPRVQVRFQEHDSGGNVAAVLKRQADVAFVTDTSGAEGCDTLPLWKERIFVVLPQNHVLCQRKAIDWQDLRNEPIIVREVVRGPVIYERFTKLLAIHHRKFPVEMLNVGRETLMHLVALGRGVALTSESTVGVSFPKVVFRPIAGKDRFVEFSAVWLPHNGNPALRRLLSLARTMTKRAESGPEGSPPDGQ